MVTESRHSCLWLRGQKKKKRGITKEQEKQLGVIIMPIILIEMMASEVYTYVRFHQTVHFKYKQCVVCQLYLH